MSDSVLAILVDGDNINYSYYDAACSYARTKCKSYRTYLFGKLSSLYLDDWQRYLPEQENVVCYDVSENRKNSTDMRMLAVALRLYYSDGIKKFLILSSDSDMDAIVTNMPGDVEIMIGYVPTKTAARYLESLKTREIECIDLDALRGGLSQEQIAGICNDVLHSYIKYKLGGNFFSYETVKQWLAERYPELSYLAVEDMLAAFCDINLHFLPEGVEVS